MANRGQLTSRHGGRARLKVPAEKKVAGQTAVEIHHTNVGASFVIFSR